MTKEQQEAVNEVVNILNHNGDESSEIKGTVDKLFQTNHAREIFRVWGIEDMGDYQLLPCREIVDKMMEQGIVYLRKPIPGKKVVLRKGQKSRPLPTTEEEAEERTVERLRRTVERWFKSGELERTEGDRYKTTVRLFKIFLLKKYLGNGSYKKVAIPAKSVSDAIKQVATNNASAKRQKNGIVDASHKSYERELFVFSS